jgi:hypothetical protein
LPASVHLWLAGYRQVAYRLKLRLRDKPLALAMGFLTETKHYPGLKIMRLKVEVLAMVGSQSNYLMIANEETEYVYGK